MKNKFLILVLLSMAFNSSSSEFHERIKVGIWKCEDSYPLGKTFSLKERILMEFKEDTYIQNGTIEVNREGQKGASILKRITRPPIDN